MEQQTYTIEEVIQITIQKLNAIQIPVGLMQQVAVPIAQSVGNLQVCLQMIKDSKIDEEQDIAEKPEITDEVTEDGREADPE